MPVTARFEGRYLNVPVLLGDDRHATTVKVDMEQLTAATYCVVPWPDEVFASDEFGSAWLRWDA